VLVSGKGVMVVLLIAVIAALLQARLFKMFLSSGHSLSRLHSLRRQLYPRIELIVPTNVFNMIVQ